MMIHEDRLASPLMVLRRYELIVFAWVGEQQRHCSYTPMK